MSTVVTINEIISFPDRVNQTIVGREEVDIEGEMAIAETRFNLAEDQEGMLEGYQRFNMVHTQKYKIEGKLWQREFNAILRIVKMQMYKKPNYNYVFTMGSAKADISHNALNRLRAATAVKVEPLDVNLIEVIEKIIRFAPNDIKIVSGWFSNLNLPNLNNALLTGVDANLGGDWQRFKTTQGAMLSNIELQITDTDFSKGYVKIALSKRGILFSHSNISPRKILEIAERILDILARQLPRTGR
ncbi:hypothetical protein [Paenibacillus sp. IHBB 3054]|uniref:hypothetical protein n=1 Tax=Paenibacillus sp. IHBB 3054 TaxID=3425689 RepID=UPI003F675DBE